MAIKPGNFTSDPTDATSFVNSMAEAMEKELNKLLVLDDLEPLSTSNTDRDVRARRRMFVAIARGVVLHLAAHPESFKLMPAIGGTTIRVNTIEVI
ncbi:hypothetical protein [Rhizobium grahamii]|uniref:Uncharacterized protein n=2 Tax=Rhizobium grahamii TaxID=1120045 RepID=S3HU81_9HYPH|nr:hypothetical protein [Rhizobium grahamii]EPE96731.1 hypothetical protein RGCCGE502_18915 [Rhizobium grahamii CCGE 502]RDJ03954.1 hypothetical protein B5K06_29055 [Rhizobium grahamii]